MSSETILRDRRKQLGLTIRQVIEQVNAHGNYHLTITGYPAYEANRRHASAKMVTAICHVLDLDPLPVLAARGLIHPALTDALTHDPEAQRTAMRALNLVART